MPGPGKWHLRGPVISMLNHICESDGVRFGLCSVCLRLGGQYGGLEKQSVGDQVHREATSGIMYCTFTHACANWGAKTDRHTHTGQLLQPCLPCNLRRQHGPSPFQIEHTVQTQKTKQTCWPPWCTVHEVRLVFSSPLTGSIYTDSKSTPLLWLGLHTYKPVIIQTCIAKRFLSVPSLPRVLFQWTLLCFRRGSTSKQPSGQIDSGREMLFH